MEHIEWMLKTLKHALEVHEAMAVIVGTFFLGESAMLASFALSAQGFINPLKAIVYVFIGSMAADIFWFFMTEYVFRPHYESYLVKRLKKAEDNENERFIMRLIDKHFFWTLIFIKFLMGMRLILTIYIVLKNRIPFYQKVAIDAVGTVLYLAVIFPAGWFLGKGISSVLAVEQGFIAVISIIVFFFLFSIVVPKVFLFIAKKFFAKDV